MRRTTTMKENDGEDNSPLSFNNNDSVNTLPEYVSTNKADSSNSSKKVKYIEVCQKAFMNVYGIIEKRIRWQKEKLILKPRYVAEKKKKELKEMDKTLTLARSLRTDCHPLFPLLEKSNCTHQSDQLMTAIEDDIALVNNFFNNQLWKPEDMINKWFNFASPDSSETEIWFKRYSVITFFFLLLLNFVSRDLLNFLMELILRAFQGRIWSIILRRGKFQKFSNTIAEFWFVFEEGKFR